MTEGVAMFDAHFRRLRIRTQCPCTSRDRQQRKDGHRQNPHQPLTSSQRARHTFDMDVRLIVTGLLELEAHVGYVGKPASVVFLERAAEQPADSGSHVYSRHT